uniref:Uncharacterized protein n=1 Tax=Panagrolaimus sp. ES5 TaxID=591445 RepID=A0AC34G7W3_9BILA
MASAKMIGAQQNGQQRKNGRGRQPQKRQQRKSKAKDENVFHPLLEFCVVSDAENNELPSPNQCSPFKEYRVSSLPFTQINGEQARQSRKRSKESTTTFSKLNPSKKRKTTETAAKRREEEDGDNIGKIDRIFFDKKLGMCANVLWYYKYKQCVLKDENREKLETKYNFDSRELIASKHTDTISCDSIQSHAFVLTFNEYSRYIAENKYDCLPSTLQSRCKELWPRGEKNYPRRRFLPHEDTPQDLVYFCRKYYSIARKGIFSSAPMPSHAQKRRIARRRPIYQLLPVCDENGNGDKSP